MSLGNTTFNMNGPNQTLNASGVNGQNLTINIGASNSVETLFGSYLTASSPNTGNTITEEGSWDKTTVGGNTGLAMEDGGFDALVGNGNDNLMCTAGYSTITSSPDSWVTGGYENVIYGGNATTFNIDGIGAALHASGASSSNPDNVNVAAGLSGVSIYGNYDDTALQGTGMTINIYGDYDPTDANSCTVDYSGNNAGDVVYGSGDGGSDVYSFDPGSFSDPNGGDPGSPPPDPSTDPTDPPVDGSGDSNPPPDGVAGAQIRRAHVLRAPAFNRIAQVGDFYVTTPQNGNSSDTNAEALLGALGSQPSAHYDYSHLISLADPIISGSSIQAYDSPISNGWLQHDVPILAASMQH